MRPAVSGKGFAKQPNKPYTHPLDKCVREWYDICMVGNFSRDTAAVMRSVGSRDTQPERVLRAALWRQGLRYKLHCDNLPGKPDLVFQSKRLAVFVDGDFWHGNQWHLRGFSSLDDQFAGAPNADYWLRKIRRNTERDCEVTARLLALGWRVLRFWESDLLADLNSCAEMVVGALRDGFCPDTYWQVASRTVAEFFAGIGLVRLALEQEGWSVAYANDIEHQKQVMYTGHFGESSGEFDLADVHDVRGRDLPPVTLATASFPCNDLSLAGARRGLAGEQSSAFWGFVRVLEEMGHRRPPMVMLENVPGFLTSHNGKDFADALRALNTYGYSVDAFFLNAESFVPQSRLRLFVVGVIDPFERVHHVTEVPADWNAETRPPALRQFILNHSDINWRMRELPVPPPRAVTLAGIVEDLDHTAREWWSADRVHYLLDQMSPRHREQARSMADRPEWSYGTVFRRVRNGKSMAELRTDGIAGCLRTPRGGSGKQILLKAGYGEYHVRLLTPRECARLMGADDYTIVVPANQALFGFGDAVCVPVIQWIARYYLNPVVNEMIRGVLLGPSALEAAS